MNVVGGALANRILPVLEHGFTEVGWRRGWDWHPETLEQNHWISSSMNWNTLFAAPSVGCVPTDEPVTHFWLPRPGVWDVPLVPRNMIELPTFDLGIHVRFRHYKNAGRRSAIIDEVSSLVARNHNVFVATDDPTVRFPGTFQWFWRLEEVGCVGFFSCLVDLFTLANCKRIVGYNWSSFFELARMLGPEREVTYLS